MVKKSFSIYNAGESIAAGNNPQVIIEIGKTHLAALMFDETEETLAAFELFDFTEEDAEGFQQLYSGITDNSKILADSFRPARVFINHEYCLPVPTFKFNKEIANHYLQVVFGEISQ